MIQRSLSYVRQFDRNLWALSLGWFVSALGFSASMPFISIYFHSSFGMSLTEIGVFFGVMALVRSLFQAIGGEVSDRVQRRTMMIWSQMARGLAFLLLAATIYWDQGFWAVSSSLLVATICGAIFHPVANAMVSDILPASKRLDGYAVTRAAGNLGWAAGPAIGGFLATASYGLLFLISAVVTVASGVVFWTLMRTPQISTITDRFRFSDILKIKDDPLLARHSVLIFLLYLVVAQLIVPFSVYSVEYVGISKTQLGYLYTLNGLMVVALQIPITRLLSRCSLASQLALGGFIYAVGYAMMGPLAGFEWFVVAIVVISLGEMAMSPPSLTLTSRLAPAGRMGRYMGVYGFFVASGWSFGPLFGGCILDWFAGSPVLAWILISLLAAVSGMGYVVYRKRFSERVEETT
ncbi:MAG: MFS transporter [bacterium]